MSKDIEFALKILENEYNDRRKYLVNTNIDSQRKDNLITDLEQIYGAIIRIRCKFELEEK